MAAVTIKIPTQLRAATGGEGTIKLDATTVGTALEALFVAHPELRSSLTDDGGDLRRFVNVYLDGEDIRYGDGLSTPVAERQELQILPAVAGGR